VRVAQRGRLIPPLLGDSCSVGATGLPPRNRLGCGFLLRLRLSPKGCHSRAGGNPCSASTSRRQASPLGACAAITKAETGAVTVLWRQPPSSAGRGHAVTFCDNFLTRMNRRSLPRSESLACP
jgi:hypothetical protein